MNILWFCFLLFISGTCCSETISDRLSLLQEGDEIVFDFHQSITVIGVVNTSDHAIQLRVATATKDVLSREEFRTWVEWYGQGAPGALSNELLTIHTDHTSVVYSEEPQRVQWLLTLLKLELTKVPEGQRRRAGPAPLSGEIDLRPLFQPKIVVDEKVVESRSTAFSIEWPTDGTELSARHLILYFPQSLSAVQAFPYWIESPSSSYHVSVVDSSRSSHP